VAKRTTSGKAKAGKSPNTKAKASKATAKRTPSKRASAPARKTTKSKTITAGKKTTGKSTKTNRTVSTNKRQSSTASNNNPGRNKKLAKIAARRIKVVKKRKTRLSDASLEEFRQMLLAKRRELIGDVNNMEDEAIRYGNHGSGGLSAMPIHMADLGSDTWEQELTLGLIENERGLLREINEALERIENKTYGICLATGKVITKARLRAQPWAKYCIEYARKCELGLV